MSKDLIQEGFCLGWGAGCAAVANFLRKEKLIPEGCSVYERILDMADSPEKVIDEFFAETECELPESDEVPF